MSSPAYSWQPFIDITTYCIQLSLDLKELESPEELYPLKDALERAKQRVAQSTGIREALEAEVKATLLMCSDFEVCSQQPTIAAGPDSC